MQSLMRHANSNITMSIYTHAVSSKKRRLKAGLDNYDMALLKNVRLTESKSLQLRVEGFNAFNHTQFFGPQSVDGNIGSSTFGRVVSANPPRLVQLGAKLVF